MVRDPVERVISWYYYVRAPWYFVERKQAFPELPLPSPAWLRKVGVPVCLGWVAAAVDRTVLSTRVLVASCSLLSYLPFSFYTVRYFFDFHFLIICDLFVS